MEEQKQCRCGQQATHLISSFYTEYLWNEESEEYIDTMEGGVDSTQPDIYLCDTCYKRYMEFGHAHTKI